MSDSRAVLVQQMFLAAIEVPEEQRAAWLIEACGDDKTILNDVRSLLEHNELHDDLLDKGLNGAMQDFPHTEIFTESDAHPVDEHKTIVGCDLFLEKLSQVGVLSPDEFDSMSESASSHDRAADPRQLASQLVSEGKLTEYQASALLKGKPDLLIDKYLILDLIDVGGMGMVFKAIHRTMNRVVAVKMISQQLLSSPEQVKRFQREVRVAATLEHPNIVRSYDADQTGGVHFLVMEYVRGQNLNQIARTSGPLPLPQAVDCIRQSAVGLQHAHEHGIVHRDIKPGNLLLDDRGTVKVLDLGLAHVDESFHGGTQESDAADVDSGRPYLSRMEPTAAGTILGTASFMAPEQSLDAHLVDFRSDVYSLGCTFYFLLTGDTPYSGSTVFKVFVQHREGEIPSLQDKRPDVPDSIESVYRQMVAKKPEDRFQSMSDLIVALDECQIALPAPTSPVRRKAETNVSTEDQATIAESDPGELSTTKAGRRKPVAMWASFAVVAALVVAALSWPEVPIGTDELSSDHDSVRLSGSPVVEPEAASASDVDASVSDDSTASAADLLATGEWEWRVEQSLGPVINSPNFEFGADMTADGLTIVVTSDRGESLDRDLWMATRPSRVSPWAAPIRLPEEINTAAREQNPRISVDGLTLRFRRENGLWITTRLKASSAWPKAVPDPDATEMRSNYGLTPDGLTAFRPRPDTSKEIINSRIDRQIMIWRRESHEDPFGASVEDEMPSALPIGSNLGTMSNDGRMYIFSQKVSREGEPSRNAVFMAIRDDQGVSWSAPAQLFSQDADMSSAPQLLRDERTFLFVSNRPGGTGNGDIWMARLVQKDPVSESASAADLLATGEWEWKLEKNLGPPISSPGVEFAADMTADGLTCVVSSSSGHDISVRNLFIATRPSTAGSWSSPVELPPEINTADEEIDPLLSADGLTLSFVRRGKNKGLVRLTTRRKSADSTWSNPVLDSNEKALGKNYSLTRDRLTAFTVKPKNPSDASSAHVLQTWRRSTPFEPFEKSTTSQLSDSGLPMKGVGTLSGDGRILIFAQQTSAREATRKMALFIVTRANWDAPWSSPVRLKFASKLNGLTAPRLQLNDKSLLFASELAEDGQGRHDIWMARMVKKEPAAESESVADLIAAGSWEWKLDRKLPEPINSPDTEFGADITADGLTIAVSSANGLEKENRDLFIATRAAPTAPWSDLTRLPAIVNTDEQEISPEFSDNGLTLSFIRRGQESPRCLTTRRDNVDADWTVPVETERGNGLGLSHSLTRDRLTAFKLQKPAPSSDDARYRLLTCRRSALSEPFGESETSIPGDSGLQMGSATLSNDGRLLIYIQDGLWMVTRNDWNSPWSKPVSLLSEFPGFQAPRLLSDDRTLLFASGRPNGGGGSLDIYMARLVEKPVSPEKATPASPADLLATGEWEWQVEKNLGPTINSPSIVFGADMTADNQTIVFSSLRQQQPPGNRDLWIASRISQDAQWSEPVRLPVEINTDSKEEQPHLSSDGLRLWFRGDGNSLMYSVRESVNSAWSEAIPDPFSVGDLKNYEMTPNGLTAFQRRSVIPDKSRAHADSEITIWKRQSLDSPFQKTSENLLLPISHTHTPGALSDDRRMFVFAQIIDDGLETRHTRLFYSTRSDKNRPWAQPSLLFSNDSDDGSSSGSPRLLDDNRTLLFSSNMKGGQGSFDIWQARLVLKNSP